MTPDDLAGRSAAGVQAGLSQARGRKPQLAAVRKLARLRQENARLAAALAQAREVIDVQGKVSGLCVPRRWPAA